MFLFFLYMLSIVPCFEVHVLYFSIMSNKECLCLCLCYHTKCLSLEKAINNNTECIRPEIASYNHIECLGPEKACCYKLIPKNLKCLSHHRLQLQGNCLLNTKSTTVQALVNKCLSPEKHVPIAFKTWSNPWAVVLNRLDSRLQHRLELWAHWVPTQQHISSPENTPQKIPDRCW